MRAAEPRGCECAAWGSHRSSTSLVPLGVLTQQSPLPHSSGCGGKCHHEDVAPTSPSSLLAQPGQPWAGGVGPRRTPPGGGRAEWGGAAYCPWAPGHGRPQGLE